MNNKRPAWSFIIIKNTNKVYALDLKERLVEKPKRRPIRNLEIELSNLYKSRNKREENSNIDREINTKIDKEINNQIDNDPPPIDNSQIDNSFELNVDSNNDTQEYFGKDMLSSFDGFDDESDLFFEDIDNDTEDFSFNFENLPFNDTNKH